MNLLASSYKICKKIIHHKLIQLCNLKKKIRSTLNSTNNSFIQFHIYHKKKYNKSNKDLKTPRSLEGTDVSKTWNTIKWLKINSSRLSGAQTLFDDLLDGIMQRNVNLASW